MGVRVPSPVLLVVSLDIVCKQRGEAAVALAVRVVPGDYQKFFDRQIRAFGRQNRVRGFRRNTRSQLGVIEQQHGAEMLRKLVLRQAVDRVLDYVKAEGLALLGSVQPQVSGISWRRGDSFVIDFALDLVPPFALALDAALVVEQLQLDITAEALDRVVEELAYRHGHLAPVDGVEASTVVSGHVAGDGKREVFFYVGASWLAKHAWQGKRVGDVIALSPAFIRAAKPLQSAHLVAEAAKQQGDLPVTIMAIQRVQPLQWDQDAFRKVLRRDVASFAAFKAAVKAALVAQYQPVVDRMFRAQMRKVLLEHHAVAVAARYTQEEVDAVVWPLLVDKVVAQYGVQAAQEEVERVVQWWQQVAQERGAVLGADAKGALYQRAQRYVIQEQAMQLMQDKITVRKKAISLSALRALQCE